jgi:aromatic ring-opening dioxygenase catalytic subunit (LigB family)
LNLSTQAQSLPTLFIPHGGGPCFFMEWDPPDTWRKMTAWLAELPAAIGVTPRALVVISGHWEAEKISITGSSHPPLLYDYSGFPPDTYKLQYPAPGSPALARQIVDLLAAAGFSAQIDPARGFDHGVFIPLKVAFPEACIPIVQLSLQAGLDAQTHIEIGRALQSLRSQGVLIVGSGMSYHNLRGFADRFGPAAEEFDSWLTGAVCSPDAQTRNTRLAQWQMAPFARTAHPREDHLLPLMVAAGAAGNDLGSRIFTDQVMGARVSAYRFGR